MPLLLERPEIILPTKTDPVLEAKGKKVGIGGSIQDSLIIPVENTRVAGFTGYLLGRHSRVQPEGSLTVTDALYLRTRAASSTPVEQRELATVERVQGYKPEVRLRYEFFEANGEILPLPSAAPYKLAFFNPSEYEGLVSAIQRNNKGSVEAIRHMNELLARRIAVCSIDPESKALILPPNYASLGIDEITRV